MSRPKGDDDGEGLLSRWSRLKRTTPEASAPQTPPADQPTPDAARQTAEPETPEEEAALLERLGLPAPETLAPGDDFSRFMGADVPAFLRRRALRILWRSNPDLAGLDGLLDYGEDFSKPDLSGVIETAYKVGRGFLRETPQSEAETEESSPRDEALAEPETAEHQTEPPVAEKSELSDQSSQALPQSPVEYDETADTSPPRPRRMVFTDET